MIDQARQILAACDTSQATTQVCQHDSTGPGAGLRIFVILAIVGIVVLGWLLLRGYQGGGNAPAQGGDRAEVDRTPVPGESEPGGRVPASPAAPPGDADR
jgi:hypothetical protein